MINISIGMCDTGPVFVHPWEYSDAEASFSHAFCFEPSSHERTTNTNDVLLTTLVLLLRWVYWRSRCHCDRWGHMVVRACFSVCLPLSSWLTWLMLATCAAGATALKSRHIPHCLILFFFFHHHVSLWVCSLNKPTHTITLATSSVLFCFFGGGGLLLEDS